MRTSFFVSVPMPWARTHGLRQGSPVGIEILEDGSLRISAHGEGEA